MKNTNLGAQGKGTKLYIEQIVLTFGSYQFPEGGYTWNSGVFLMLKGRVVSGAWRMFSGEEFKHYQREARTVCTKMLTVDGLQMRQQEDLLY